MKNLIVFDFDWSLADQDSDYYAIANLSPEFKQKFSTSFSSKEWYLAMDDTFQEIYQAGFKKEDLLKNLETFPIHAKTIELIKKSKELGYDVVIISDGNTLFINQILSNYNLKPYITQLITNKVREHEDGRLNLIPCRDPVKEAHGCENKLSSGRKLCNGNLCKGTELKNLKNKHEYNKIIYTGDGQNDFCPMLQLRSQDIMCIRKSRALERLYSSGKNNYELKSKVEFWSTGDELYNIFENEVFQ